MKSMILVFLFSLVTFFDAAVSETTTTKCPCPEGYNCTTPRIICVYGIIDNGTVYHNDNVDAWNLTEAIHLRRKLNDKFSGYNDDDVTTGLYNLHFDPQPLFFIACYKCDVFQHLNKISKPKLKLYLLSIYLQRMKFNLQYREMPESGEVSVDIIVPEFWKNRLDFHAVRRCYFRPPQKFEPKHYIPQFLSQHLCVFEFEERASWHGNFSGGSKKFFYSWTLSNSDLFKYELLPNAEEDDPFINAPPSITAVQMSMCKLVLQINHSQYVFKYVCVCQNDYRCLQDVDLRNPYSICLNKAQVDLPQPQDVYNVNIITQWTGVNHLFLHPESTCHFDWIVEHANQTAVFKTDPITRRDGFYFKTHGSRCLTDSFDDEIIIPTYTVLVNNASSWELNKTFNKTLTDHFRFSPESNFSSAQECQEIFANHVYSSVRGTTTFPCFDYTEIIKGTAVYPMMGVNTSPLDLIEGNICSYITVKLDFEHFSTCSQDLTSNYPVSVMVIAACPPGYDNPDNYTIAEAEFVREWKLSCPTTLEDDPTKWRYESVKNSTHKCGQFLYGLKLVAGVYVPDQVILGPVNTTHLEWVNLNAKPLGCGFNTSMNLTLCVCSAAVGGCDNLYYVGKLHVLKYIPQHDYVPRED